MARNYSELRDKVRARPGAEERVKAHKARMVHQLRLAEVRQARQMTQEQLATILEIKQSGVSRIEHQTDVYLSTLRSYIEAVGGHLELRAVFPDGDDVEIRSVEADLSDDDERVPA